VTLIDQASLEVMDQFDQFEPVQQSQHDAADANPAALFP
jgi:hypothetical protein